MTDDFWKTWHLKPYPPKLWPEAVRAWMTLVAMLACGFGLVCILIILFLIIRMGYDALTLPTPAYQEAARNFLVAFAGVFGVPFLVWRAFIGHWQAKVATEQARIALENHVTGNFIKSIELLGLLRETKIRAQDGTEITSHVPNTSARLGALYSLERLMHESEKDQRSILETLCAYIRENSPLEIPTEEPAAAEFRRGKTPPLPARRVDVQAALTIIGRRSEIIRKRTKDEGFRLNLTNANLILYDFSGLNYDHTDFENSFLNEASIHNSSFVNCTFKNDHFSKAKIYKTHFNGSAFESCSFIKAQIEDSDFRSCNFCSSDLRNAAVRQIKLEGANLEHAFGPFVKYAIDAIKRNEDIHVYAQEMVQLKELFEAATIDGKTIISNDINDALTWMRVKIKHPATHQEKNTSCGAMDTRVEPAYDVSSALQRKERP
jgi:hypothetical protein